MESEDSRLSTTALAKKLNIPTQQLFATLRDYGWIQRAGDTWTLTPKGEFEGGSYQHSRRFGRYIVWPQRLDHHPLLGAIESNQRITAASMNRYYPRLHARQINRALAELGLQQHSILGWELTALGKKLGGQQEESKNSGAFYVTWPHEIVDHAVVHRELTRQSDQAQRPKAGEGYEGDLFAAGEAETVICGGIDGHQLQTPLQASICNWLYLAQLAHACQRALPVEELLYADFYVPVGNVYIDCWEADVPASELSEKLHQREIYREMQLRHIEINGDDVDRLDEVLGRGLLAYGIRC
tara:strand:+ start:13102 stop:13995 length:894 start_codon:yes stop_codon:yes gene_type:complete